MATIFSTIEYHWARDRFSLGYVHSLPLPLSFVQASLTLRMITFWSSHMIATVLANNHYVEQRFNHDARWLTAGVSVNNSMLFRMMTGCLHCVSR